MTKFCKIAKEQSFQIFFFNVNHSIWEQNKADFMGKCLVSVKTNVFEKLMNIAVNNSRLLASEY